MPVTAVAAGHSDSTSLRRGASINVADLSRVYDGGPEPVLALDRVSLTISPSEFFCIVGPSGCGKSTFLRILAGLDAASSGRADVQADGWRVRDAMVFQDSGLFPWMDVRTNVRFGLDARGVPRVEADTSVDAVLALTGLTRVQHQYPHQLSGGLRQRCAIARAFVTEPGLLLMDEPFGALDAQNRLLLQAELVRLWMSTGQTVIYVTHSIEEALLLGDRVAIMTAQPGQIKAIVEVPFARPRDLMTLSADPAFGRLKASIWQVLEDEVMRARDQGPRDAQS